MEKQTLASLHRSLSEKSKTSWTVKGISLQIAMLHNLRQNGEQKSKIILAANFTTTPLKSCSNPAVKNIEHISVCLTSAHCL